MAIQFARIEVVSRAGGANACCKSAYNARSKITDAQTGVTYNFQRKGDNVFHEVVLPEYADPKFKDLQILMNEVELSEKRKDSQLLKDVVIALPDDKELDLNDRIEITKRIIEKAGWVRDGLGVQVDIHEPHNGETNWHAHLLVTTRRFTLDGQGFGPKARDLNPEFKSSRKGGFIVPEERILHEDVRDIINDCFKELGLSNRVDLISSVPGEHIGPVRMRSLFNQKQDRNYERQIANIESLDSGDRLLDRVTNNSSVFSRSDLIKAASLVPDSKRANSIINEALSSSDIEALYNENGEETSYYTTKEVRLEELKLLRLADYVAAQKNVFLVNGEKKGVSSVKLEEAIAKASKSLSIEQKEALSHLLLSESGMRLLRGRAGTGKSHILKGIAAACKASKINLIGLSPTHKAKAGFSESGFEQSDTIKGMLFKLHNGKFYLPPRSLIVVDEAGMVGSDDYLELLRVAAKQRCNVIHIGDERQIASIQRGGMFEVFADKYGSKCLLNIQRQRENWGREVVSAFANGEVRTGIDILIQEGRIVQNSDKFSSIQTLLQDWSKSSEAVHNKLILAVKNDDVDLLNKGARIFLKANNRLSGPEVSIGKIGYASGDRIVIKETRKELSLINGDFAEIVKASKEEFVIRIEGKSQNRTDPKEISFNPSEYQGFGHGYATTVYKSQGASINDVFVLHDGFGSLRSSYVSLSRNIKALKLYYNKASTRDIEHLIKQLGRDPEISSSLNYFTLEDLNKKAELKDKEEEKSILTQVASFAMKHAKAKLTELADKHFELASYYNFEISPLKKEQVEEMLDIAAESRLETAETAEVEEALAANGGRGYRTNAPKEEWERDHARLRLEAAFKSEQIALDLLGSPNRRLSSSKTLRFGTSGKIAVLISGENMGTWYDFSEGSGGDMFTLATRQRGGDFKDASEYLRSITGATQTSHLTLVYSHQNSDLTKDHIKAVKARDKEEKAKVLKVQKLYLKSENIQPNSTASIYLSEKRHITCDLTEDIKSYTAFIKDSKEHMPEIVAFARNKEGAITGYQQIILDPITNNKADILPNKKSFGKIAGSFVYLSKVTTAQHNELEKLDQEEYSHKNITIIAEGLETGLSVKQALDATHHNRATQINILCSLGISNISNYTPSQNEKIIIAADNDGESVITFKTIENAKISLEQKGAFVEVVSPKTIGDFNDVLKQSGEKEIQKTFSAAIARYEAKTLHQFFGQEIYELLSKQEISDLEYIRKYNYPEEQIVDSYRKSNLKGLLELERTRKTILVAEHHYDKRKAVLQEVNEQGTEQDRQLKQKIIKDIYGMDDHEVKSYLENLATIPEDNFNIRKVHKDLESLLSIRPQAKTPQEAMQALKKEQEYLVNLSLETIDIADGRAEGGHKGLINSVGAALENKANDTLGKLYKVTHYAFKQKILTLDAVTEHLKAPNDPRIIHQDVSKICYDHHCTLIKDHLHQISNGITITHDGHKFDSAIDYLNHFKKNVDHSLLPINQINKTIESELEKSHHVALDHDHHLDM